MSKLLVDDVRGYQSILDVGPGGAYVPAEPSRTLWDERVDGPLDVATVQAQLGGWTKVGAALVFDSAKKTASDAALVQAQSADTTALNTKLTRIAILKAVKSASTLADLKSILVALVQQLGLD